MCLLGWAGGGHCSTSGFGGSSFPETIPGKQKHEKRGVRQTEVGRSVKDSSVKDSYES